MKHIIAEQECRMLLNSAENFDSLIDDVYKEFEQLQLKNTQLQINLTSERNLQSKIRATTKKDFAIAKQLVHHLLKKASHFTQPLSCGTVKISAGAN